MNDKIKSAIKKITLNTATFNGSVIEPSFVNYFYGGNGTGKSTIARAIRANDGVEWQEAETADNFDVLYFGQDFVNRNFSSYSNLPGVFTVCEANIEIQAQIDEKSAEKAALEEEFRRCSALASARGEEKNNAAETFQNVCWDKTRDVQNNFKEAIKGFRRKAQFAEKVLSFSPAVEHDVSKLKTLYDVAFDADARIYPEFVRAGSSSATYGRLPGGALMDKIIVSSRDTPFAEFIRAINASDWVREGHERFHGASGNICPYCQQALPETFETDISICFDAQYQRDINNLKAFKTAYCRETGAILDKLRDNLNNAMPSVDKRLLDDYSSKLALLERSIEINNQRIAGKLKEPASIVALEDTDSLLINIGALIDDINKEIISNNDIVNNKKQQKNACIAQVWEHIAFMLRDDVNAYKKNRADIENDIISLNEKADKARREAAELTVSIAGLNRQTVSTKAAIDNINEMLKTSGFQGFRINDRAGVQNTYEVIRSDGSIAEDLSDGERGFIAFLYFCQLVNGSQSSERIKDKIVVIDDPVFGMDSNSMSVITGLVRGMADSCVQNSESEHRALRRGCIRQIFILTHNMHFYRELTYDRTAQDGNVNFYLVGKENNISGVKLCPRQNDAADGDGD